jgi:hypothetical protein
MTTVLPETHVEAPAPADDATPGCGCCIPPPGAGAKAQVLAELASRRDAIERRLQGLTPGD